MGMRWTKPAFGAAVMVSLSGCLLQPEPVRTDAVAGLSLYAKNCAECHGADAKGSGPAALGLGSPPPDLTVLSQRNDGVFPQDFVMDVIDGYNRREHLGSVMPEFGQDDLGPIVLVEEDGVSTPTPADLVALANYLRSVQQ